MEQYAKYLEEHPFIRILDSLSKLGIIFAVVVWILEIPSRIDERELAKRQGVFRAWEIIANSELMPQSPARKLALEDLLKVNMMPEGVDIRNTPLDGGDFNGISFRLSYLAFLTFSGAQLKNSTFDYAYLESIDFGTADLSGASFKGSIIKDSDFSTAKNLGSVDFSKSILVNVSGLPNSYYLPEENVLSDILEMAKRPSDWLETKDVEDTINLVEGVVQEKANKKSKPTP